MSTDQVQVSAALRRAAAESERHDHGDIAYRAYRSAVPGVVAARRVPGGPETKIRAALEPRGGKELVHTSGYFTRYGRAYPMWDNFGMYRERVRRGAGARTLAAKPEVAFLTNHTGMAMARTTSGTLELREDAEGGWHDGWLNPKRSDVNDLVIAIEDGDIPQMSFAFMIPEGCGEWSDDFTDFEITRYDIDGGDVSATNFGANPYTDISARAAEMLSDLTRMPAGAQREAMARLSASRSGRERIEVAAAPAVDPTASPMVRRMQGLRARITDRYLYAADAMGLTVADLPRLALPWYEIRAGEPMPAHDAAEEDDPAEEESTNVYIFDEIGGSFGTSAKQFAQDLNEITTPQINLHINSPGGSVFDGLAIHSTLMHHPSWITASVDGIAASAASVVALGADVIETMPGGEWMMHDASTTVDGNQAEIAHAAEKLGEQSQNIAGLYATRLGITVEQAREMMLAETWVYADESVEMGLADRVGGRTKKKKVPRKPMMPEPDMAERMARKHDLTRFGYRYSSRSAAPSPLRFTRSGHAPTVIVPDQKTPSGRMGRSIDLIAAIVDRESRS